MLKPFLLVFNDTQITRQTILNYLDTRPEIKNWFAFLPAAVFIISDHTAPSLAGLIRNVFPGKDFVVTEVTSGSNDGWLARNVWEFINYPHSSGRWPG
jgi:hypothetical protein